MNPIHLTSDQLNIIVAFGEVFKPIKDVQMDHCMVTVHPNSTIELTPRETIVQP